MNGRQIFWLLLLTLPLSSFSQRPIIVLSPSNTVKVSIQVKDSIYYNVEMNNGMVIAPSSIALLTDHGTLGINSHVSGSKRRAVRDQIINPVPFKRKVIPDHFNEVAIRFREHFSLVFRAYDDGIAYHFETSFPDSIHVINEIASFRFTNESSVYFPEVQKRDNLDIYHTSFEEPYKILPITAVNSSQLCFTPTLVDNKSIKSVITESDIKDYPGMFLRGTGANGLKGEFARYPDKEEIQGGEFKQWVVLSRKKFIARTTGRRLFPWRVIALSASDAGLLINDLVYRLATPPARQDWSWIKTGISTEEWIASSNLFHVGFKAGVNTDTYKYYIDFAKKFGLQFVMLDAGWSDNNDLFKITPGLDLKEVARYARENKVGLILWTLAMTLDRQLDKAMEMFQDLGVNAINTDFMDRDDQKTMAFYHRVADAAAKHHLMVMYHGAFKNAGFERTHPNSITREAVLGSEYNIWSDKASPEHDLLIPFIRMVSGPMDYEPGFYQNANQRTFRALPDMVMSQGTRTHQLAMFVVYESPIQMFSANPSEAWPESDFTTYLGSLPTTWDETRALDAKVGDYLIIARRKGSDWYLAAMTDWTPRQLTADLSFLGGGKYTALICADGPNASKAPKDYRMSTEVVDSTKNLTINMSAGGGYVAKLIKMKDERP